MEDIKYYYDGFRLINWFRFKFWWKEQDHIDHINNIFSNKTELKLEDVKEVEYHTEWLLDKNFKNFGEIKFGDISSENLSNLIDTLEESPILQTIVLTNSFNQGLITFENLYNKIIELYKNEDISIESLHDNFGWNEKTLFSCASQYTKNKFLFSYKDIDLLDDFLSYVNIEQIPKFISVNQHIGMNAKKIISLLHGYDIDNYKDLLAKVTYSGFFAGYLDKAYISKLINENLTYSPLNTLSFAYDIGFAINEKTLFKVFNLVRNNQAKLNEFKEILKQNITKFTMIKLSDYTEPSVANSFEIESNLSTYENIYKFTVIELNNFNSKVDSNNSFSQNNEFTSGLPSKLFDTSNKHDNLDLEEDNYYSDYYN